MTEPNSSSPSMIPPAPSSSTSSSQSTQTPSPKTGIDALPSDLRTVYTWGNFFTLFLGGGSEPLLHKYISAQSIAKEAQDCQRCITDVDWLFQNSPMIRFLRGEINKLGHDLGPAKVFCRRCEGLGRQAGYSEDVGVLLCSNLVKGRGKLEDTLAHEMVHAYDSLRFFVDRTNMKHQACTEIRAATLSGECRFTNEFFNKGQFKFTAHLQDCVRRRATLSLMRRPACKGDDVKALRIVDEVWDSCFGDTRPFDEIFR